VCAFEKFGKSVATRHVNLSVFEDFCLSVFVEVDQGDRLLSAGRWNDLRTEPDDRLPLKSAEWRSMRASYFAQLLQFFMKLREAVKDVRSGHDHKGK
jgi:hypothetical protein